MAHPQQGRHARVDPSRILVDRWEGFGCSLSWWAVFTADWPEQSRQEVCRRLFGRGEDCLGWNIARYNAGGTKPDADPKRFRPGGKVQVILDRDGSFNPDRDAGQIAALRQAARLGADTFELFVNSPPYWMLRSGRTHGGDHGSENLRPECEEEYARWVVRLTTLLERHARIRFASVEPFNEPSADWWRSDREGQEGCRILPPAQARILRHLRNEMVRARRSWLIACSDEHNPHAALQTLEHLLGPGGLKPSAIGRVNVHTYAAWEWQERLREWMERRGLRRLWMSEVTHREWGEPGYVPREMRCALPVSRAIVNDLRRLRPQAWVYWQPLEPLEYCLRYRFTYGLLQGAAQEPLEWDGRTLRPGDYVLSKAFWAMMQFSRFIRPGDRLVVTDDFWTLAALSRDGRRLTVVAHNDEAEEKPFSLDVRAWGTPAMARAWRTMEDRDGVAWDCRPMDFLSLQDGVLSHTLPARSVTTYVMERGRRSSR